KFGVLELFWESLKVGDVKRLLPNAIAIKPPSTEPVNGIDTWDSLACFRMSDEAILDVSCRLPLVQRAQIVQLACLEPVAKGLHITHWSSVDLARQAVKGWDCRWHQPTHRAEDLARCRSATSPHSLLENTSTRCQVQRESGASPLVLWQCGSSGGPRRLGRLCR